MCSPAAATASPVPFGCSWIATTTPSGSRSSSRRFGLSTTTTFPAPASCAAATGHRISGRPQSGCRTFGSAERIRVPSPAAMMTTVGADTVRIVVSASSHDRFGESSNRPGRWVLVPVIRVRVLAPQCVPRGFDRLPHRQPIEPTRHAWGEDRLGWAAFMRILPLAAAVAALLVPAAPAFAGDPTMPLWQVHAGMQCTGYSVIQGTTISPFDVQVLDVAAGEAAGIGNILIAVSGPAVDATGIGPGFSGSPIYCPDGAGRQPGHRRDLAVGQRVRRQGRAGDVDRGDPRARRSTCRSGPSRRRRG